MSDSGGSRDGKSDVDRPFLPERKGQAKGAFDRAEEGKTERRTSAGRRASDGNSEATGKTIGRAKRGAPGPSLDMPGGGPIKQAYAAERLSSQAAAAKQERDVAKVVAKKMEKSPGKEHNNHKTRRDDRGRE